MGHCASLIEFQKYDEINRNASISLFIKQDIENYTKDKGVNVNKNMYKDYEMFVEYIKSGIWLDKSLNIEKFEKKEIISNFEITNDIQVNESNSINDDKDILLSYMVPENYSITARRSFNSSSPIPLENNNEHRIRKHPNNILESYPDFNVTYFTLDELILILFYILYPMYLEALIEKDKLDSSSDLGSQCNSVSSYGSPYYRSNYSTSSPFITETNKLCTNNLKLSKRRLNLTTNDTSRTQEILYTTSAYFDGSYMLQVLNQNQWIDKVIQLVDHCEFGITIIDVKNEIKHYPIIYLNNAIHNMYGSHQKYYGKTFFALINPLKESIDLIRNKIIDALNHSKPLKIAFKNHNIHTKNIFTNFIKIKPIYSSQGDYLYAICIHYDFEGI